MRTPLRSMQGFAELLVEEHSDQLNEEGKSHLERIARSASRMDALIRDVLNYTRVLRGNAPLTSIDLEGLIRDLIPSYPAWQNPADVQIRGHLPHVLGHEGLLTQCVSNLVGNAIKFVSPGVTPKVVIWAEEKTQMSTDKSSGPTVRIWFEDHGIGIAPKDRERVFRMFERIHPTEQFEGTGIGLTIVRKAVERMNGGIDFESEDCGSRFWIEIQKAP